MQLKEALQNAIAAHGSWKVKFRDFMDGKLDLDPMVVQKNNACDFGKWLESNGPQVLARGDFDEIHKLHNEFHSVAAGVVRKKKTGDTGGAQQDLSLRGPFTLASATLTKKMMDVLDKQH